MNQDISLMFIQTFSQFESSLYMCMFLGPSSHSLCKSSGSVAPLTRLSHSSFAPMPKVWTASFTSSNILYSPSFTLLLKGMYANLVFSFDLTVFSDQSSYLLVNSPSNVAQPTRLRGSSCDPMPRSEAASFKSSNTLYSPSSSLLSMDLFAHCVSSFHFPNNLVTRLHL